MHAVILHEAGRVDAEEIGDLAARSRLIFEAGGAVPMYAVLAVCGSSFEAMNQAAELRRLARQKSEVGSQRSVGERE